jgi:phage terminase Nu1 subunit (DNA packaging protein)
MGMDDQRKPLVSKRRLATFLDLKGTRGIEKWMAQGMPYIRVGRLVRFDVDDVLRWLGDRASDG